MVADVRAERIDQLAGDVWEHQHDHADRGTVSATFVLTQIRAESIHVETDRCPRGAADDPTWGATR